MNKFHSTGLFLFALAAGVFMFHCAAAKPVINGIVDKCVEVTRPGTDVAVICATADDVLPFLDLIMARRVAAKKSVFDAGSD